MLFIAPCIAWGVFCSGVWVAGKNLGHPNSIKVDFEISFNIGCSI